MSIEIISSPRAPAAIGPYSQATRVGNMVFTSGQIPLDMDGQLVDGDVAAQTHQVFRNLQSVLAAAECTLSNVVKATVFLRDMNDFATVNEIYATYFGAHKPARSTVQVARLPKDVAVEIDLIAFVDTN
jgi:2-iminobutanoate/2-iminopropanoate deaminase